MQFEPTDWKTWFNLEDHPIFTERKADIETWSYDPTQYCELQNYGRFFPSHYLHSYPPVAAEIQTAIATLDVSNLAEASRKIMETYGHAKHEIVILDDFTVYVWLRNERFSIQIYPLQLDLKYKLMLFATQPVQIDELCCRDVMDLMAKLDAQIVG